MPFSSPVASAKVYIVASDETIDLWMPTHPFLVGATVSLNIGGIPTVTLELEAPYSDGITMLESGLFDVGNILSVRLGYSTQGVYTPWYYGLLLEPKVSLSPDGFTATLVGNPVAGMIGVSAVRQFLDKAPSEVVESIAHSYGMKVSFKGDTKEWNKARTSYEQSGLTDWEFLRAVILNAGCTFHLGTDINGAATLFATSYNDLNAQEPVRKFRMFGPFDPSKSMYPLLSFDSDLKVAFAPAITRGIKSSEIDLDSKAVATVTADQTTSPTIGTRAKALWGRLTGEGTTTSDGGLVSARGCIDETEAGKFVYAPTRADSETVTTKLQAAFDENRHRAGISGTISTPGNPYVLPMDLVELDGLSKRFNGTYRIQTVEHKFSAGSWETSAEVISEGYSTDVQFAEDTATGSNTATAPEAAESARTEKGE